ncbi:hypothetical protein [Streptomyces sp. NPDC002785]|uniref:hypothetical protein n=1 Tax=Streptomyces sp. NPDC002785 TaxID=3154543 RepID=UPI003325517F
MPKTPDAVAVASLDTHRLIITVPNNGPADVVSNLAPSTVAGILRHLAAQIEGRTPAHDPRPAANTPTAEETQQ